MDKPFYKSKTFWGALIAAVPVPGAPILAAIVSAIPESAPVDPTTGEAQIIIAFVGLCVTLYGRYKATGSITLK